MINFTFKGHKISIRNDDWRKLKERFNPENAERDGDGDYVIEIPCALCERYKNCEECPLDGIDEYKCSSIFDYIFRKRCFFPFRKSRLWWFENDNSQARRQLKVILRRMEKIEAGQGEG